MADAAKNFRTIKRTTFNARVKTVNQLVLADEKCLYIMNEAIELLKDAYDELIMAANDYASYLIPDDVEKALCYVEDVETAYLQAKLAATRQKSTIPVAAPPALPQSSKPSVKCKAIEFESFSNQIRDYPAWKHKFKTHFQSYYGDQAGIVLKNALHGESYAMVRSLEEVDDIFTVLDSKYGVHQKIVDSVMSSIEVLSVCRENDVDGLRNLLQTIQLAENDLDFLKLGSEIRHSSTVKLIERRLPTSLKQKWAKYKLDKNIILTAGLFSGMISFLKAELQCAEDVATMGGMPSCMIAQTSDSCKVAQSTNHAVKNSKPTISIPATKSPAPTVAASAQNQSTRYCTVHKSEGHHWPRWCRILRQKNTEEQVQWFLGEGKDCCRLCLSRGHGTDGSKCPVKYRKCGQDGCEKKHASFLHEALSILREKEKPANSNSYAASATETSAATSESGSYRNTVSPAQKVFISCSPNEPVPIGALIDTGSVVTLIHNRVVRLANLKRSDDQVYHVTMETVGGDLRKFGAYAYEINLQGSSSNIISIIALGVDAIGGPFPNIDMSVAKSLFDITDDSVEYPSSFNLDLLVGMDNAHLALSTISSVNGLILAENSLGSVIYGSHPSFVKGNPCHYRATCYFTGTLADLYSTETLGVECSPKCGACRCGKCAPGSGTLSLKEEREYQLIRDGMVMENNYVVARYPWIKDPGELPNNYDLAFKRLIQTERRLCRDPSAAKKYKEQIEDMLQRGVARKLTDEEDSEWTSVSGNPVQYLPHHEVLKPSSKSTPVRIVFDPSSPYRGQAVNNYWGTGPNLILNSLGLMIRFRENRTAVVADIAKMYQTVHTTPMEWHCHRFLWRNLDESKKPETYIIVRNSFGSRPAGAVAIAALYMIADAGEEKFPIGARTIREQTYVDDIMDSTSDVTSAQELTRQTDECLALGSFRVKGWTIVDTRDPDHHPSTTPENRQIGGSEETVMGTMWDMSSDAFFFLAKLNFSPRKKKIRVSPNLKPDEILTMTTPLTLRGILSQVNGYYDPMGLVGPYLVELKFSLGKLWRTMRANHPEADALWDIEIPSDYDLHWRNILNASFSLESLRFSRHLKPDNTVGQPWLIVFCDSSMMSFGTCAYIRWCLNDNSFWCRLVASKSRIWPINENDFLSMCRGELQGAVLAKRLAQTIITESRFQFERVLYVTDSDIVRAQIAKDSHAFDVFVGNRVGEIRSTTSPDQWYHIPGSENVCADLLSRGSIIPDTMNSESAWQNGPTFLYKVFSEWPVSQRYNSDKPLPELRDQSMHHRTMTIQATDVSSTTNIYGDCAWNDVQSSYATSIGPTVTKTEVVTVFDDVTEQDIVQRIDITRFSKLQTLLGATYRILHALSWKPGQGHFAEFMTGLRVVTAEHRELALQFWIRAAQRDLLVDIKRGKFLRLKPVQDSNSKIWYLNGRFGDHPQGYHPILLPNSHPFVALLVTAIHRRGHGGVTATSAKVKDLYHVLGLKRLVKKIRTACTLCRRISKRLVVAPMAPLPFERFREAYAFEFCSCDIFGPFPLQVPGRITRGRPMTSYGSGYGLIFTCLSTRAIHVEAMEGQDTSAFLLAFRRFMSMRGQPRFMYSDNGGQIVAADTELKDIVHGWDDDALRKFGAENGIRWQYISPDSPWQNGVTEALIKSVKRSMAQMWQSKPRIPIMELQTLFYEISGLLNERPINLGHSEVPSDWDSESNVYLCPNQLLLGRSTIKIPSGPFGVSCSNHSELFHRVQTIVNEWWERWSSLYLPTLLRQSKWHNEGRTVKVGDVVHVKDSNLIRGDWQIAEVISAEPSSDGIVRQVKLRYKKLPDTPLGIYHGAPDRIEIRDVKNLVILITADERPARL